MDLELILKVVFLGLIHWALVPIALTNMVQRERVLGRIKVLWALAIIFVTCFGPLSYLIIHELIPQPQARVNYSEDERR